MHEVVKKIVGMEHFAYEKTRKEITPSVFKKIRPELEKQLGKDIDFSIRLRIMEVFHDHDKKALENLAKKDFGSSGKNNTNVRAILHFKEKLNDDVIINLLERNLKYIPLKQLKEKWGLVHPKEFAEKAMKSKFSKQFGRYMLETDPHKSVFYFDKFSKPTQKKIMEEYGLSEAKNKKEIIKKLIQKLYFNHDNEEVFKKAISGLDPIERYWGLFQVFRQNTLLESGFIAKKRNLTKEEQSEDFSARLQKHFSNPVKKAKAMKEIEEGELYTHLSMFEELKFKFLRHAMDEYGPNIVDEWCGKTYSPEFTDLINHTNNPFKLRAKLKNMGISDLSFRSHPELDEFIRLDRLAPIVKKVVYDEDVTLKDPFFDTVELNKNKKADLLKELKSIKKNVFNAKDIDEFDKKMRVGGNNLQRIVSKKSSLIKSVNVHLLEHLFRIMAVQRLSKEGKFKKLLEKCSSKLDENTRDQISFELEKNPDEYADVISLVLEQDPGLGTEFKQYQIIGHEKYNNILHVDPETENYLLEKLVKTNGINVAPVMFSWLSSRVSEKTLLEKYEKFSDKQKEDVGLIYPYSILLSKKFLGKIKRINYDRMLKMAGQGWQGFIVSKALLERIKKNKINALKNLFRSYNPKQTDQDLLTLYDATNYAELNEDEAIKLLPHSKDKFLTELISQKISSKKGKIKAISSVKKEDIAKKFFDDVKKDLTNEELVDVYTKNKYGFMVSEVNKRLKENAIPLFIKNIGSIGAKEALKQMFSTKNINLFPKSVVQNHFHQEMKELVEKDPKLELVEKYVKWESDYTKNPPKIINVYKQLIREGNAKAIKPLKKYLMETRLKGRIDAKETFYKIIGEALSVMPEEAHSNVLKEISSDKEAKKIIFEAEKNGADPKKLWEKRIAKKWKGRNKDFLNLRSRIYSKVNNLKESNLPESLETEIIRSPWLKELRKELQSALRKYNSEKEGGIMNSLKNKEFNILINDLLEGKRVNRQSMKMVIEDKDVKELISLIKERGIGKPLKAILPYCHKYRLRNILFSLLNKVPTEELVRVNSELIGSEKYRNALTYWMNKKSRKEKIYLSAANLLSDYYSDLDSFLKVVKNARVASSLRKQFSLEDKEFSELTEIALNKKSEKFMKTKAIKMLKNTLMLGDNFTVRDLEDKSEKIKELCASYSLDQVKDLKKSGLVVSPVQGFNILEDEKNKDSITKVSWLMGFDKPVKFIARESLSAVQPVVQKGFANGVRHALKIRELKKANKQKELNEEERRMNTAVMDKASKSGKTKKTLRSAGFNLTDEIFIIKPIGTHRIILQEKKGGIVIWFGNHTQYDNFRA